MSTSSHAKINLIASSRLFCEMSFWMKSTCKTEMKALHQASEKEVRGIKPTK